MKTLTKKGENPPEEILEYSLMAAGLSTQELEEGLKAASDTVDLNPTQQVLVTREHYYFGVDAENKKIAALEKDLAEANERIEQLIGASTGGAHNEQVSSVSLCFLVVH